MGDFCTRFIWVRNIVASVAIYTKGGLAVSAFKRFDMGTISSYIKLLFMARAAAFIDCNGHIALVRIEELDP